jgi:hypothetical protein
MVNAMNAEDKMKIAADTYGGNKDKMSDKLMNGTINPTR